MTDLAARRVPVWTGIFIVLLSGGGCSSSNERPSAGEPTPPQVLQLKQIYQMSLAPDDKPDRPKPKTTNDLLKAERLYPQGAKALKNGDCVFVWSAYNAPSADPAATVLAYMKNVPEEGGYVLMVDGTIKQMSADEFKAAPKAK